MSARFDSVEGVLADLRRGRMAIVCDGAGREGEGDVFVAAEFATPSAINFMAKEACGLVCLALSAERCDRLGLEPMGRPFEPRRGTAFTVSIEAREGVTTGISARDRARTVEVAIDPERGAGDLVKPGHVLPVRAEPGGVVEHAGHPEAVVELARLAGLQPAAVFCGILDADGRMARSGDLGRYAQRHRLKRIAAIDLVGHRVDSEASSVEPKRTAFNFGRPEGDQSQKGVRTRAARAA